MSTQNTQHNRRGVRRALATLGLGLVLAGGAAAGVAQADTDVTNGMRLGPGSDGAVHSWFFGKTRVCFDNVGPGDGSVSFWSGPTTGWRALPPGGHECITGSFVGLDVGVRNQSPNATIVVSEPFGPASP